jgi:transposase
VGGGNLEVPPTRPHSPPRGACTRNATTPPTSTAAATSGTILALGLGKYKSVACADDRATTEARFHTLETTRDELRQRLERQRPAVIVFEACTLAGWVHDLCAELGLRGKVADTASAAWKCKHAKRKTDKDDALRLAQLEARGQLPTVVVPPKPTREWRALIRYRQVLVGRRVAIQNHLRALFVGQGLPAPRGHRAWTAAGLAGLEQHAHALADCAPDERWRGLLARSLREYRPVVALLDEAEARLDALAKAGARGAILTPTPGVGPRTAEAMAAYLHEPARFKNGKRVSAYVGMVPRQYQSGETDRRGRITRRGPALLRKLLVECAWVMLRYNAWARAIYQRLRRGQARRKQAIVALARKLLVRCWAMLRDKAKWRDEAPTPTPASAARGTAGPERP